VVCVPKTIGPTERECTIPHRVGSDTAVSTHPRWGAIDKLLIRPPRVTIA